MTSLKAWLANAEAFFSRSHTALPASETEATRKASYTRIVCKACAKLTRLFKLES